MKKILCICAGLMIVAAPCFGQASKKAVQVVVDNAAKKSTQVTKRAANRVKNVSSKALKAQLKSNIITSQLANQISQQTLAGVMANGSLEKAQKLALIKQLNEENAAVLKEWSEQITIARMRWADALVRERNTKFLPPKDKEIPGLIAMAPKEGMTNLEPFYFREWARLIPLHDGTPEQFQGLIIGLRQRLIHLDMRYRELMEKAIKTEERFIKEGKPLPERYFVSQERKLSKEAAQCVSDLVSLLNLYPALYKDSFTLLAVKLDQLGYTTPFIEYIRPQIPVENLSAKLKKAAASRERPAPIRGFRQYEAEEPVKAPAAPKSEERVKIKGFGQD